MRIPAEAVREWVVGVLRGIWQPEPDEEIWEWAERTLRIPDTENEELAGQFWSSIRGPYVRALMEWVKRPGKGEFWVKKSSQVGFTMACLIIVCWFIAHRPGNIGYALDSIGEAKNISRTRLRRWIELNHLLDQIGEEEDGLTNLVYYLKAATVYFLGGNSAGAVANKSTIVFILDEYDKHGMIEGSTTAGHARERCKRPKNAKIIGLSTPGDADEIRKEHARGSCEEWRFPFPCCGHEQALKWENFVFGTKEFRDLAGDYDREKVAAGAYFKCELCGGKLLNHDKMAAMNKGRAVATNPKATPGIRSMHVWDAYSSFVTFGELALQWIDAQGDEVRIGRFMRGRRGEQFERDGRSLTEKQILACRGGYARGTVPFVPVLLCQAVDIQGDVQKAVKVAFDKNGDAWVVDWLTTLVLGEASDWAYEPVSGPGGELFTVTDGFIDEGHRQMDVLRMCLAHMPVFWPVKGRAGIQVRDIVGTSPRWCDGEEIIAYHIAEDQFKWQMLRMIRDREKRRQNGEPVLHFPVDADSDMDFMFEFLSERPVQEKDKYGRLKWVWKKEKYPNDFPDCVKYCLSIWYIKKPILLPEGVNAPKGDFDMAAESDD